MSKVAYCFLLNDTIQHLKIWEHFFRQDINNTANIYSHVKTITDKTPEWIRNNQVQTVPTSWCGEGLIHAFNQMLKKALSNKSNKYFVLVSGSDIPLYNYQETYKKICSTDKARLYYMRIPGNVFPDSNNIYNAHQWVILNRKIARDYLRLSDKKDTKAMKFIKDLRNLYKENGVIIKKGETKAAEDADWLGGCPDEIYPINWLVKLYGPHTDHKFKKYIKNSQTTYSSWDFVKDPLHPKVFDLKSVKRSRKEICGRGHLFARKFTEDAAEYISMRCGKGPEHTKWKTDQIMVRKELVGRLGNQMFQYASALGIAHSKGLKEKKNADACIITDPKVINYDALRSAQEDLINVCKGPFLVCAPDNGHYFQTIPEKAYGRYNIRQFMTPGNIEIETDMDQGFLQSFKYFEPIKEVIKEKFQFRDDIVENVNKYLSIIRASGQKIVGIHVRRGDHLELGYLRSPPVEYFNKAKNYFRKKFGNVRFVVATNDRQWVSENLIDSDTEIIKFSKNAPEDMATLAACDGVIMSLGTFSFWAGWLSGGPVVYYKKEFVMNHEINKGKIKKSDYYPPDWIGM